MDFIMSAKPFVKWAGGKTQLLTEILPLIPEKFNNYFEPFVGGGAVFFALGDRLAGKRAYINDINAALVGAYKNIQKREGALISELSSLQSEYHQKTKEEQQVFYYKIREKYNDGALSADALQKSVYFLFLNKIGYNGMYSENS